MPSHPTRIKKMHTSNMVISDDEKSIAKEREFKKQMFLQFSEQIDLINPQLGTELKTKILTTANDTIYQAGFELPPSRIKEMIDFEKEIRKKSIT